MSTRSRSGNKISFSERVATAFVAVFAAIVTLALYPIALFVLLGGTELSLYLYAVMFSKIGIALVLAAGMLGFWLGGERMANIFGFLWGTHSLWTRVGAYLNDKADVLRTEHNLSLPALLVLVVLVIAFVIWKYLSSGA